MRTASSIDFFVINCCFGESIWLQNLYAGGGAQLGWVRSSVVKYGNSR
jgi:hypothetical protein